MSSLLCAASARNSCPSGSPGETASFLPSRSFGVLMPARGERDHREAGGVEQRHHRLDLGALCGGRDHAGGIREAERVGAGRHHLHGVGRAAAFVDREVDAFLFVEAALLAVIERHVQPAHVPVEAQADGVLRQRRASMDAASTASAPDDRFEFHLLSSPRFRSVQVSVTSARLLRDVPRDRDAFDDLDHVVDRKPDQAEQHDDGEHHRRFEIAVVLQQQIAEPAIRRDELGDDRGGRRQRGADLQAGEDVGQRLRQADLRRTSSSRRRRWCARNP